MRKVKLIDHEIYQGKRKTEDVFVAVFLSNATTLTQNTIFSVMRTEVLTALLAMALPTTISLTFKGTSSGFLT